MIYLIWALLPITLFLMAVWAFLKPFLKVYGKEDPKRYMMMFGFCTAIFWLAMKADQTEKIRELTLQLTFGVVHYDIVRITLYPAMLYLASVIWDFFDESKKNKQYR